MVKIGQRSKMTRTIASGCVWFTSFCTTCSISGSQTWPFALSTQIYRLCGTAEFKGDREQDMTSSRKRKQRPEFHTNYSRSDAPDFIMQDDAEPAEQGHNLDSLLFVQAYEADIIRGPRASQAAASLEVFDYRTGTLPVRKIGDALIQWGEDQLGKPPAFPGDEDELIGRDNATQSQNDDNNTVWVDRYVVSCSIALRAILVRFHGHLLL